MKSQYTPVRANWGTLFVFFACIVATSLFATGVHGKNDNIYSMIATTAVVIGISQCMYAGITTLQYMYASALASYHSITGKHKTKREIRRSTLEDSRNTERHDKDLFDYFKNTCTAYEMLVHTIDFQHRRQEIKLWISREDLWKIMYPVSTGIYISFLAIPAYDPVCTICFCAGIFSRAIVTEYRRGYYWNRTQARKALLLSIILIGIFKIILLFVCGYMAMLENTNQGWERHETWKLEMLGIYPNGTNETFHDSFPGNDTKIDKDIFDEVLDENGYVREEVDRQYVHWFVHAYPAKCWMWWFFCFYAGPLLETMPTSVRMPVMVEKSQMSTSSIALSALFVVLGVTRSSVFDFVQIQSALGDVYLLFAAPCLWACVFCLCHGIREKSSLGLTLPLSLVSLCKSFTMLRSDFWVQQNAQIFAVSAFAYIFYFVSVVCFLRVENVAIRSGWGVRNGDFGGLSDDEECMEIHRGKSMDVISEEGANGDDGKFSLQESSGEVDAVTEETQDAEVPIADKSLQG